LQQSNGNSKVAIESTNGQMGLGRPKTYEFSRYFIQTNLFFTVAYIDFFTDISDGRLDIAH
jgi:hypothetical protein